MNITRRQAIAMYKQLGRMAIGHLNDADLGIVMDNMDELKKVAEQYSQLASELHRRLFEGVDLSRCEEYDRLVKEDDSDAAEAGFADIDALVKKKVSVLAGLERKEVCVNVEKVDKKSFMKAIYKAQPDIHPLAFEVLAPMFEEDAKADADLTELDELLNI